MEYVEQVDWVIKYDTHFMGTVHTCVIKAANYEGALETFNQLHPEGFVISCMKKYQLN